MLLNLVFLLISASITDCKKSQIKNKHILICSLSSILLDLFYYLLWSRESFLPFITNFLLLSLVSAFMYAYHLWAAGDCKLMMTIALSLPGRFLTTWDIGPFASFVIIIITFSLAFIYLILETIFLDIKNKSIFKIQFKSFNWKHFFISYSFMSSATTIISFGLSMAFPHVYSSNTMLLMAINYLTVLSLIQVRSCLSFKAQAVFSSIIWIMIFLVSTLKYGAIPFSVNLRSLAAVFIIMMAWSFAEKYNYQAIPVSEVKAGQIMSLATIMDFSISGVQGLPMGKTEDLRSRITNEEAETIRKWENSKTGKPYVIIVRKMPFAVFISIGTIVFLCFEILMR